MSRFRRAKKGYQSGDPRFICDVCGFEYRLSERRRRWDGLIVCPEDWEPKHGQDLKPPKIFDSKPIMDARPPPEDILKDGVYQNWEEISINWEGWYSTFEDPFIQ